MAKKKTYTGFHKEKPEDLTIYKEKYLNDFELIRLSNFLTEVEFKIISIVNLSQKLRDASHRDEFRMPYHMIKEMTGWEKKFLRKYLDSLREQTILIMVRPGKWKFHIPTIARLLSGPQVSLSERKTPSNDRKDFNKLYDQVIWNRQVQPDPLFAGLKEGWENL